jgi:hypothetical protein
MKNIGKYQGTPCYECTDREYKEVYKKKQDDGHQIYIIDGTMVKRGIIIGHYDGNSVRDVYDGVPYVVVKQPGPQMPVEKEPEASVPTGKTEIKEIVYSDYTKVVDNFFAHLNDPVI